MLLLIFEDTGRKQINGWMKKLFNFNKKAASRGCGF